MCEMLAITASHPVPIDEILRWSRLLDQYGVAGFGWGIASTDGTHLFRYRSVRGIRQDDTAEAALRGLTVTRAFIHLRRPSRMSTIGHLNAQPYQSEGQPWAFAHNGYFARYQEHLATYQTELQGTSDSEVGFLLCRDYLKNGLSLTESLAETHNRLQGHANLMALCQDGTLAVYAGNPDNPVYRFSLGPVQMVTTSLHSPDRYLFDTIFPSAHAITPMAVGTSLLMP